MTQNNQQTPKKTDQHDSTEITDGLDPAERDARWLRHWYPLPFVSKVAIIVVACLLALVLAIYYAVGTHWGTQFLLNAVVQQTGIGLKVGEGNLRDGLWVYEIKVPANPPSNNIEVSVDKAYVKIGWRALFSKQVHLRQADVGQVIITNHKPKSNSDEPFAFEKIALPVDLVLDDTKAKLVRYEQPASEIKLDFTKADVKGFTWFDSEINVKTATLGFNDLLTIDKVSGKIDLQNDYPLDVDATVAIHALEKVYFDKIDGHISGSLKSLTANVTSRYNNAEITGVATARPLEPKVPFNAKLTWQDALLPYATDQDIRLKNGTITAAGVYDNIDLAVDTDLTAKDIPNGHYQGVANTDGNRLTIDDLTAVLAEGTLTSRGVIDWQDRVNISLINTAQGFAIRKLLPTDIAPYAPKLLNGQVDFVMDVATDSEPMTIKANLAQDDGERVNAVIRQASGDNTPYHITADWQHYIRKNVPNIGDIASQNGRATVLYQGANQNGQNDSLEVNATANIDKLNIAPKGDYQIQLKKIGDNIAINNFDYHGIAGALTGTGDLTLAAANRPLNWQVNAKANRFHLNQVIDSVPLAGLTGDVVAKGVMKSGANNRTEHQINISNINMLGDMIASNAKQNTSKKRLSLTGAGDVDLTLTGSELSHLVAKFDGSLDTPDVPKGKFKFDIAGNLQQLAINEFVHQSDTGSINAKGKLDLANGVGWDLTANMNQFDASFFAPNLPSHLTGKVATDGYWRDDVQFVRLQNLDLSGKLKNQALTATGSLIAKLKLPKDLSSLQTIFNQKHYNKAKQLIDELKADNLLLKWGNNRIHATGNQQQLVTSVDISTLNQLVPQLKGMVRGGIVLNQQPNQTLPNMMIDLAGRNISVPNFRVLDATVKGDIVNLANSPSNLTVNATGLNVANQPLRELQLQFNGTQQDHRLDVKTQSTRGNVQASLKGKIDLDKKIWQGVLGNGQVGTKYAKLQQIQPTQMVLNWQNPSVKLAKHCWQMSGQTGKLCLNDNLDVSNQNGKINISLHDIDSQIFTVILPEDIAWSGKLNGSALVNWQKNSRPTVNASFYSDNGTLGTAAQSPDEVATTVAYERVSAIARSTTDGLKLRVDLKTANDAGNGYLDAVINPYQANKPIDGTLVFEQLQLAILKPFFPALERLTGTALLAGKVTGTLASPKFVGDIEAQDASLSVTALPMRFDNINILASVDGNQAKITGDFITPNNGKGLLTGTVDWVNELQAKLKLTGDSLQLSQPPLITAKVNPVFDIILRPLRQQVDITGVIDIPQAIIRPPEASADVVTQSADVNVIDRRLAGQIDQVLKVSKPWSINADIGVDLGKSVEFQGFGAKLPLAGALYLTQRGQGSMKAQGVVQVAKRSKVEVFGQNLDLNFAQVRFNGAVTNPSVNMQATKDIQGTQVGVKVTGNVNKPNIVVFNNGGLTEQQAMNALVTGSLNNNSGQTTNEQDFKDRVNNTLAAAGLSFGLSSTRGLTNQIGRAIGLQGLTLDATGTGSDTLVSITGYITPDLFIRYGVGVFTAQPELSMRYQMTRRLYIEGKSATNKAIDLIYNWRY